MSTMKKILMITIAVFALLGMESCGKNYLNRPPLAAPTAGTFYQSDAEILSGTGPLYNGSWGGYNGTSLQYIGDIMGGNSLSDNYLGRGSYLNFTVTSTDPSGALESAYQALWSVVANANVVAYNIENAGAGASAAGKTEGLAECYFMRASAYYFLVLDWGAVPIIYNNTAQLGDDSIRRNNVSDVWQFIINDLTWCKNNLPAAPIQAARVTRWSAEGMLARAYLCMSGYGQSGGSRNQADLDSAIYYAGDVCNNSGLTLEPYYYNLFTSKYFSGSTVPSECLFALLWSPTGGYQVQNHMQANLAYSPLITQTGDGWGAAFGASPSLLQYFMDNPADSQRRRATFFMPNDFYPDINQNNGGWRVDTTLFNNATNSATGDHIYSPVTSGTYYGDDHAYVKKYVIGAPSDNGNVGGTQNENLNTYIFRLADVYLIYADAILGNSGTTSDPRALQYFNAVRARAGMPAKTSIAYTDLMQERKVEFAFEGHAWYDWKTWYYFDPTDAMQYFNTQNRGQYNISYNGGNPFVTWLNDATSPMALGPHTYTIPASATDLPYPESELLVAPALSEPPVPFDFTKVNY